LYSFFYDNSLDKQTARPSKSLKIPDHVPFIWLVKKGREYHFDLSCIFSR